MNLLKLGCKGVAVVELQRLLNTVSAAGLVTDGDYGAATYRAVKAFQAKNKLVADGVAGPVTISRLQSLLPPTAPVSTLSTELTADQLSKILKIPLDRAQAFLSPLLAAMREFNINTIPRIAMFISNAGVESGGFSALVENLNYSAIGLSNTWPSRYAEKGPNGKGIPGKPNALAISIARRPEQIANLTYAGRMGNGSAETYDGWNYRGRGILGVTGKNNYTACGKALGMDLLQNPDYLQTPEGACRAGAWYWSACKANDYADVGDFDGTCDLVNIGRKTIREGDAIGYKERNDNYLRAMAVLGF